MYAKTLLETETVRHRLAMAPSYLKVRVAKLQMLINIHKPLGP